MFPTTLSPFLREIYNCNNKDKTDESIYTKSFMTFDSFSFTSSFLCLLTITNNAYCYVWLQSHDICLIYIHLKPLNE